MNLPLVEIITQPFMIRAIIAAVILAISGGVLGSFIQMRGMSFYTDTIAHSTFTGVALGVLLNTNLELTAVIFAILMGIFVLQLRKDTSLSFDTILGVIFATVASLGIFLLTYLENVRVDLFNLLFGDILALSWNDVGIILVLGVISLSIIWGIHKQLILEAIHPDLASVEGVPINRNNFLFGIVVATMIAVGIKLIGIILLSGLFLIPSATGYLVASSFRSFLTIGIISGIIAVITGTIISVGLDTATGPTIVLCASFLFILGYVMKLMRYR